MTTENNKTIAEFMGNTNYLYNNDKYSNYFFLTDSEGNELKESYNTDWNWLMEVVEKIESLSYYVKILKSTCIVVDVEERCIVIELNKLTKKEAVYNACVEFIKWYNEQKK